MYRSQGLQTIKTVLVWLLVRIILGTEGVVQFDILQSIEVYVGEIYREMQRR